MRVTVYADCIYVITEYFKYSSIRRHSYFLRIMWVAVKRAGCCVVAFGGPEKSQFITANARSDVPLLWLQACQWLR